ncbi:hypothetical protein [Rhodovulum euryhalinum]|uniref:hypothetical protein n=1 Tax=Rhodovulum euryhalinum TaxID=35805 RepID=UPI00104CE68A|nr:hypothetical protein [Rhodovulum euryhalinum]
MAVCTLVGLPAHADPLDPYSLGEATVSLPLGWAVTGAARDHGVDLAGPGGEVLMAFWWFPDEPLAPEPDTLLFEMRSFPAGPALVQTQRIGRLASASVVFEHANAEGERLILRLEGEGMDPAALLAQLLDLAGQVHFAGQAAAAVSAPGSGPGLAANHTDPASGLALHVPEGWSRYGADLPGLRLIALMPQGADALVQVAVARPQGGRDAAQVLAEYETLLYREAVIPRQIEAERDVTLAGLPGRSTTVLARLYSIGGLSLPYERGLATLSRAGDADRAVLVLQVHHPEAGAYLVALLEGVRQSVALAPERHHADSPDVPTPMAQLRPPQAPPPMAAVPADPPPAQTPTQTGPAPRTPSATPGWEAVLAQVGALLGKADCAPADPAGLAASGALAELGLAPQHGARCGPLALYAVTLPVDPRGGAAGLLGLAAQRAQAAQGAPLALVDPARRAVMAIEPGPNGLSVRVLELGADTTSGEAAIDPARAFGRAEAFRQIAARSPIEALGHRVSDGAALQIAQIALIFDPEGRAERLAPVLGGAITSLYGLGSAAPVAAFYHPFADIALLTVWDAAFERIEAVEMVPGAPLRGLAPPLDAAPGWQVLGLSAPVALGLNAARTHAALGADCAAGAGSESCPWGGHDEEGFGVLATLAMVLWTRSQVQAMTVVEAGTSEAAAARDAWNALYGEFGLAQGRAQGLSDTDRRAFEGLPADLWHGFRPAAFGGAEGRAMLILHAKDRPDLFIAVEAAASGDAPLTSASLLTFSGFQSNLDLIEERVK